MINSTEEALFLLQDTDLAEMDRTTAIQYLRNHPSSAGVEALVAALEDGDFAVSESAATALATLGERALPALLHALAQGPVGVELRERAWQVLYKNSSPMVRAESEQLLKAIHSPDADVATMEAAGKLLKQLDSR
jgi:HEAT repeat protein